MSSEDTSIRVEGLGKRYEIYAQPADRLKQMVLPRLARMAGMKPREYFKEFWALRNTSFEVKRGETVGIVGRNGSGKSTLLQMICGTLHPTLGNINVNGRIAALLELGAGFNPEFTGKENVFLSGLLYGIPERELRDRYEAICDFAGIGEFIDQPVKTYSSGMAIRLAFSVAINVSPEVLVIDEALSVGDELFQRKCFSRIEEIRTNGATILFVSHSAAAVIELCDRAILIDSGELLAEGQPKSIVNYYHKLLYSPAEETARIRDEIKQTSQTTVSHVVEVSKGGVLVQLDKIANVEETYDPGLKPSTTSYFVPKGAYIDGEPSLWTLDGTRVNGLIRGRRYRYLYKVKFLRSLYCVRFGMSIKSITGLSICGTLSEAKMLSGKNISSDRQFAIVEFQFDCMLNPGMYFMNAGIFGIEEFGKEESLLHRIADVLAFRVLPVTENKSTELVDLNCEAVVQVDG